MASYSLLIKGGMVCREKKLERLDVGIKDDKIQAVGDLSRDKGGIEIDASGRYVSPGFIDLTSHSDTHWTLFSYPSQESFLLQGVTTILGGNCGSSLAPLVSVEDIAGIERWVNLREININWHRVSEFLKEFSRHPLGVNFATLVGHGTLRQGVMGPEPKAATVKEINEMKLLLDASLAEGAFGLSTNLGLPQGFPASFDELAELFSVVRKRGGLTKHHLKDEGKNILPALVQMLQLARDTGARINFSHFKILGRSAWPSFHDALRLLDEGREEGLNPTLDIFPYTRTGSALSQFLPPWAWDGGREKILANFKNLSFRKELKSYFKGLTLHYDRITVASVMENAEVVGNNLATLSARSGLEPEEVILRLLEINGLGVSIFNEVILLEHLEELVQKPYVAIASDGVGYAAAARSALDFPHPRSYGSFPRALQIFTKAKNLLPFAELLYKMTEFPAQILGLQGRGKIQKGFFADLVVLDPEIIASEADWANPYLPPVGIEWVLVNGKVAVKGGKYNGVLGGRVLRKG